MAVVTGMLITNAGQAKIAADISGGADLALSHVAWGDAAGAPYDPVPTQTTLVAEKYRATIAAAAVIGGALVIDAILPADTNDGSGRASHSFSVAECGVFASDGTLIAIARMGNGYKPGPTSGQAVSATYRLKIAVANPSAITVVVDPQAQIAVGRWARAPWLTVDGVLNAPPATPATGATYLIGTAPTGAWAGFAGRLAQWVGVWSLASAPEGHIVGNSGVAELDPLRFLKRIGGVWLSARATETAHGVIRLATAAEVDEATEAFAAVTPALMRSQFQARTRERFSADRVFYVRADGNDSNTGLADTAAAAFQTLQGAANAVRRRYDPAGYEVAFLIGVGTFAPATFDAWTAAVTIASTSGVAVTTEITAPAGQYAILSRRGTKTTVQNIKTVGVGGGLSASNAGHLIYAGVSFANAGAQVYAEYGGLCVAAGAYQITTGAAQHWLANAGGNIVAQGMTISIPAAVAFTHFALAQGSGSNINGGGGLGISGAGVAGTTGQRYLVNTNAVINMAGAGASALPGDVAGAAATGGQYV